MIAALSILCFALVVTCVVLACKLSMARHESRDHERSRKEAWSRVDRRIAELRKTEAQLEEWQARANRAEVRIEKAREDLAG